MKVWKKLITCFTLLFFLFVLVSCDKEEEGEKEKLDFTICDEKQIPDELKEILEEKKETVFKLTFATKDYLYVAIGYGEQNRSNLDIVVEDFSLGKNAIYVKTQLVGKDEEDKEIVTYPIIVLKCPYMDLPVVFE
ncbi:MAG: protease complex subunit PrcB family protein [Lachnospiraceae bacterium]|nr:protease complex subunit PrcB family protein [Lachnospiraceae bacterium]